MAILTNTTTLSGTGEILLFQTVLECATAVLNGTGHWYSTLVVLECIIATHERYSKHSYCIGI